MTSRLAISQPANRRNGYIGLERMDMTLGTLIIVDAPNQYRRNSAAGSHPIIERDGSILCLSPEDC